MTTNPAVTKTLATWHDIAARKDLATLPSIVHPDAVFRSPMAHKPYHSAAALVLVLSTVIQVFERFTYHREFVSADGHSVALEFSARVADRDLKGIDLIRFDEAGQILEFEVMVRPATALQALGAEMAKRLGHLLPSYA